MLYEVSSSSISSFTYDGSADVYDDNPDSFEGVLPILREPDVSSEASAICIRVFKSNCSDG